VVGINVNEEERGGGVLTNGAQRIWKEFWGLDIGRTGDNGVINETEHLERRSSVSKRDLAAGQHVIIDSHC
jgi:hypothetical protein